MEGTSTLREEVCLHSTNYTGWTRLPHLLSCINAIPLQWPLRLVSSTNLSVWMSSPTIGSITLANFINWDSKLMLQRNGSSLHAFLQHCHHFINNFSCGVNIQEDESRSNPVHMNKQMQRHCGGNPLIVDVYENPISAIQYDLPQSISGCSSALVLPPQQAFLY